MERAGEDPVSASAENERPCDGSGVPAAPEIEWLRDFAQISPVAIFRADTHGSCVYASERWIELSGFPREAALGNGWEKAVHPEDMPRVIEAWLRSKEQGIPCRTELRYVQPCGKIVWVLAETVEERTPAGQVVGYVSTVTDISELHRLREELQLSHQRLEERVRERTAELEHMAMIVSASGDAIISSDLSGKIVSWNRAAEKIFGYRAAEMMGRTTFVLTPADRLEEARLLKVRVRRGERVDGFETVRVAHSGELIEVALSIFPLPDTDGTIIGTSAIVRDMREQKKAQRRLHQLSGRLLRLQDEERRRLARELHDSTAQSLAALALNISALRQPTTSYSSEKRSALLAEAVALAESIGRELRTHTYLLHPPLLDERGLEAALRWLVAGFAERSGLKVELEIEPDLGRLPDQMEMTIFRVVQESLSNVHRHAGSATARVQLGVDDEAIVLEVRDAGRGLPPNVEQCIGVGIAGMRERLAQVGGELAITSNSSGTIVTARIPEP